MTNSSQLPDAPKSPEWVRHIPGLTPFVIALAVVVGLTIFLPRYLKRVAVDDLRGVPEQTSSGVVRQCLDDPWHFGGGGPFNAVVLEFNRHQVYWDLPETSAWKPMIGELVEVHYRVGRTGNHIVHIDSVQWGTSMDPQFRKL